MKRIVSVFMMVVMIGISSFAFAADQKIVGVVEKIQISGNVATVTLKDNKTGNKVPIQVIDNLTLDKLRISGSWWEMRFAANIMMLMAKT